jgi:hypothetical protein
MPLILLFKAKIELLPLIVLTLILQKWQKPLRKHASRKGKQSEPSSDAPGELVTVTAVTQREMKGSNLLRLQSLVPTVIISNGASCGSRHDHHDDVVGLTVDSTWIR